MHLDMVLMGGRPIRQRDTDNESCGMPVQACLAIATSIQRALQVRLVDLEAAGHPVPLKHAYVSNVYRLVELCKANSGGDNDLS